MGKWLFIAVFILWLSGCKSIKTPNIVTPSVPEPTAQSTEVEPTPTQLSTETVTAITATPTSIVTMTKPQMNDPILNAKLIQAAEAGESSMVLQLLDQGANINAQDDHGRTPVMAATHGNHVETVQALIEAGADINIRDNRLDNPFLYAGAEGLLEILKLTIDAGADTRLTNRFGGTALIPAADRGHVNTVKELLTRTNVDVNHVNNLGWTALLEAIILGEGGERHTEVVRLLVEAGADVNLADSNGVTPLAHARQRGFDPITNILERAGAK